MHGPWCSGPLRGFVVLLACLGPWVAVVAQVVLDPPSLRCATVNAAGDVTLSWTPPVDPGGDFAQYEIFHGVAPGGPFVPIGIVPVFGQTTFTHGTTGANAGPQCYYMTTVSSSPLPNTSVASDTVCTLYLDVNQSVPLGSAWLSWNAPSSPATSSTQFMVWMEYPIGTWTLLDSVLGNTFTYQHVISVCDDSLTFRVGLSDEIGCVSYSNLDGDVFADVTPPTVPVVATASVDSVSGLATVDWLASPQPDTQGYIIVLFTPGGGVIIDTVFGQNNTFYTWPFSNALNEPESFTVAAFDTCYTGSPPSPNTSATRPPHTTMHAFTEYDRCAGRVSVFWTPYVGWPVQSHQVFYQVDGGPWLLLTTVASNEVSVEHDILPGRNYCYVVRASIAQGGLSSLSNKVCRTASYPTIPAFNYLRTVTVTGPSQITVIDSVDISAQAGSYRFLRSDNGGPFEQVAVFPGSVGPVLVYQDDDVDPATVGYRYIVAVDDSCGTEAVVSNIGGNIVLRATPELTGNNLLEWNGYEQWAGTTVVHSIERRIDNELPTLLTTVPPDPWTWRDDVTPFTGSAGRFCYRITATEGGNPSGVNATSTSNEACAVQEELVYIPNAFIVGSPFNPMFQPVLAYTDVTNYELSIINRWGQVIWTTTDRDIPWDGRVDGALVPIGVYAYYCAFNNGAGRRVEKRGTVTLLTAVD